MRIDTLCKSLCGNSIYCLTITNDLAEDYMTREQERESFRYFEYDNGGVLKTLQKEKRTKKKNSKKQ
jgi:hypothetical protein